LITDHDDPSSIALAGRLELTLFPEIRLHRTVKPPSCQNVLSCPEAVEGMPAALFEGTYRPQVKALRSQQGEFIVEVFDQGEPGSSREEITGDSFSIELIGGAYNCYTGVATSRAATSRWSRRSSSPKLQALITSTEGSEVTPESGFSTRSR
jgi:hypothetical protein